MDNELQQIGERLKGLREALELTQEEFASPFGISAEDYILYEAGKKDFSISLLKNIAKHYNVELTALMFDDEPRMNSYFITRKGKGPTRNRVEDYHYEALAAGFHNRKADIFVVTVEPKSEPVEIHRSSHAGQEFNLILEGRMLMEINGKEVVLETGDSIYFDSSLPHGMKALDNSKVKFLAMIL